jgi:cation diffusion facilitator family transporter
MSSHSSERLAQLSIAASIATITLKLGAFFLTNSVSLLSDALESFVNLIAAAVTFFMIRLAQKPPDKDHPYGHSKAEYISSITEGTFILLAATAIIGTAVMRLLNPSPLQQPGIGLLLSVSASLINLFVGQVLIREGKKRHSIALEADGHHLMTDVWTTAGVLVALAIVYLSGHTVLDPLVAIVVGLNIIFSGVSIIYRSLAGFMDGAIDRAYVHHIHAVFDIYSKKDAIQFHGLRTRVAGSRKFISFHVLVPGDWTVQKAHTLVEQVEKDIRGEVPHATITSHIEPVEDPAAWNDEGLDR